MCKNGKWWLKWQIILSGGVLKLYVAAKVVDNFNGQYVKMGSGGQKWHIILIATSSNRKW